MALIPPSNVDFVVSSPYDGFITWKNENPIQHYIEIWENKAGAGYVLKNTIGGHEEFYELPSLDPNTEYCYKLKVGWYEPAQESDFSAEDCETTYAALQAPSQINTVVFSNFIEITWKDNSADEDVFCIERKLGAGAFSEIATVPRNVEYYRDTTVAAGSNYTYRVRARQNPSNYSGYATGTEVTANSLPGTVQNLQTSDITDQEIRLTWQAPSSGGIVTGYKIEKSTNGVEFTEIAVVDSDVLTFLVRGLTASTAFWFRVRAYNGVGNGPYASMGADALTDGNMELWTTDTDLTHWTEEGSPQEIHKESSIKHQGSFSARMYTAQQGDFTAFHQNFTMTAGQKRTIVIWHQSSITGINDGRLYIRDSGSNVWLNSSGQWVGGTTYIPLPPGTTWAKIELHITAHASYSNYNIRFYKGHGTESAASYYLDDCHVMSGAAFTLAQYERTEFEKFIRDPKINPVFIAELELKMDLSGFTLTGGQTYTYEKAVDERGLTFDYVWEDGTALTKKTSIAEVEAAAGSWWWDPAAKKLYVHATDDADPDTHFMEGGFTHRIPSRDFPYADDLCTLPPWLAKDSIPSVTQEIKPYYEGSFRLSSGAVSFFNAQSKGAPYFDKRFETFTWIGSKLGLYCGKETFDTLTKFKKMFTAYISDKTIEDRFFTVSLLDIRDDLERDFVLNKYWLADYPQMDEDFEGKEKLRAWGYIQDVAPVPFESYNAAEKKSAKFHFHDGRVKTIGTLSVNGTTKTENTDYYVDPQRGIICFSASLEIKADDIILISFIGQVNTADEPIENGADAFKHILNIDAGIPTTDLNTDWIYETKYANTKNMAILLYKDTNFGEIIQTIEHSTEAYILQDGAGRLGLRAKQTTVSSRAKYIWDFQSREHRHSKGKSSLFWKVKVYYNENPQTQTWDMKEAKKDQIWWRFKVKKELPIYVYYSSSANAQALATSILNLLNKTYIEDRLPAILFDVYPGDLVPFSRNRFFDSSGTASELALRILRIEKDLQNGETAVTMEKAT